MLRIDSTTAIAVRPTPPAVGTQGYFTAGTPPSVPPTNFNAHWCNAVQESLRAVSVGSGAPLQGDWSDDYWLYNAIVALSLQNGITGGEINSTAGNLNTHITVTGGSAKSDIGMVPVLWGTLTKNCNAAWVAGNNNGGLLQTSSLEANKTYNVYAIKRAADGVGDIAMVRSETAIGTVLPAGYTHYTLLGQRLSNGLSQLLPMIQFSNCSKFLSPVTSINAQTPGTTATNYTIAAPLGRRVRPIMIVRADDPNPGGYAAATNGVRIYEVGMPSAAAINDDTVVYSTNAHSSYEEGVTWRGFDGSVLTHVYTNLLAQIRARQSNNSCPFSLTVEGWYDDKRGLI